MRPFRSTFFILFLLALVSCASSKKARVRQEKLQTVIRTAKSFIGTPYKWGGTTRAGMDCSGLLINSYAAIHFQLPRTSHEQSKIGQKIKLKDLEPGDLVFFATGKKKHKITHVGMVTYVQRDLVKFIHSSSSLGVIESNLDSKYYRKRFITARRPF